MGLLYRLLAVMGCTLAAVATSLAQTEKRVALVIGNAGYQVGPLRNPVNDATAVAELLQKRLGFKIILKQNLGFEAFRAALLEFSRAAAGAEVGLVYFAGHGTEVNGRNFLIPVDAKLAEAGDLDLEAVALDTVLAQLAGVRQLKLVILDACRNNVFALAGGKRSVTRGLGRIEPEENSLVVYAAKDGTTAEDGTGKHSPFTDALLTHIATPGLEISFVFRRVRDDVAAATKSVQVPHVYGTLGGKEFYLQLQMTEVEREWARLDKSTLSDLETFVRRHGSSVEADYARARIEHLKKQAASAPAAVKAVAPPAAKSLGDPFDGVWLLKGTAKSGCKSPGWGHRVEVRESEIFVGDQKRGRIEKNGAFTYSFVSFTGFQLASTGKISDGGGSGNYRAPRGRCTGALTLRKE